MTKRKALGTLCLLISLFIGRECIAQPLGNLIGIGSPGTERVAIEYNYIGRVVEEDRGTTKFEITSNRFFVKGDYSLSNFANLFLKLGAADLDVPTKDPKYTDCDGDFRFAYGGGVKVRPLVIGQSGFFLIGQGVALTSEGRINDRANHVRIKEKYRWREYQAALAFATQIKKVNLYLGLGKTWLEGKRDWTKYLIPSNQPIDKGSADFSDDQQSLRPFIGVDLQLPQGYAVSLEAGGVGKDEVTLMLGFSQKSSR